MLNIAGACTSNGTVEGVGQIHKQESDYKEPVSHGKTCHEVKVLAVE